MSRLTVYLARLPAAKAALWCYLIWYLAMAAYHFDATPSLWLNSLGLSVVIGTALVLSVLPPGGIAAMARWQIMRLYLMPFAVSSFAALIKDRSFIIVFSPVPAENLTAATACAVFIALRVACRRWVKA